MPMMAIGSWASRRAGGVCGPGAGVRVGVGTGVCVGSSPDGGAACTDGGVSCPDGGVSCRDGSVSSGNRRMTASACSARRWPASSSTVRNSKNTVPRSPGKSLPSSELDSMTSTESRP